MSIGTLIAAEPVIVGGIIDPAGTVFSTDATSVADLLAEQMAGTSVSQETADQALYPQQPTDALPGAS